MDTLSDESNPSLKVNKVFLNLKLIKIMLFETKVLFCIANVLVVIYIPEIIYFENTFREENFSHIKSSFFFKYIYFIKYEI